MSSAIMECAYKSVLTTKCPHMHTQYVCKDSATFTNFQYEITVVRHHSCEICC